MNHFKDSRGELRTRITLANTLVLVDGRNEFTIPGNSVIGLVKLDEYAWQIVTLNGKNFAGFSRLNDFEIEQYTM